ncbi:MAG: 50S ribosomal protein L11 methyltransferase, partial [Thermodesulfobacteriota bacterium]
MGLGSQGVSEYIINHNTIELNSYFEADTVIEEVVENTEIFIKIVNIETKNISPAKFSWEYIDKSSWDIWKSYLKMVKVSKRVVIKPPWESYKAVNDEHVIEINPSLAFGTGHHETTTICIKYLDEITRTYKINTVLDIGSGSGILGICSVKLGVKYAVCIDNDFIAVKETVLNSRRNGVEANIY